MKAKKSYSVTRNNPRTGRTVTKTKSADGSKSKTVSVYSDKPSGTSTGRKTRNVVKTKTKSTDGSKSKSKTTTIHAAHSMSPKASQSRRYLAGTQVVKSKSKSADGSKSKSKIVKGPSQSDLNKAQKLKDSGRKLTRSQEGQLKRNRGVGKK
jgi:hypothetical protein